MRILVTGAAGWLGRHLAPLLFADGHEVVGLDLAPGPFVSHRGSVADRAAVDAVFAHADIEAVIHAAALHKPDIAREPAQAFVDVNVSGTLNLLKAAAAAGVSAFVFASTTSLMVSAAVREERSGEAAWMDETFGPLEPRNIYGATKLAAEQLCRIWSSDYGIPTLCLRLARFFPEEDDTIRDLTGPNLKANEFLHRRLTVEDAARACAAALDAASTIAFGLYVISATPPFARSDARALFDDACGVIARRFPDAAELYARQGWRLPRRISRVYDPAAAARDLGFVARTDFAAVLASLRRGEPPPLVHDPSYVSPRVRG